MVIVDETYLELNECWVVYENDYVGPWLAVFPTREAAERYIDTEELETNNAWREDADA